MKNKLTLEVMLLIQLEGKMKDENDWNMLSIYHYLSEDTIKKYSNNLD